jgi:hypothetical protein
LFTEEEDEEMTFQPGPKHGEYLLLLLCNDLALPSCPSYSSLVSALSPLSSFDETMST